MGQFHGAENVNAFEQYYGDCGVILVCDEEKEAHNEAKQEKRGTLKESRSEQGWEGARKRKKRRVRKEQQDAKGLS